MWVTSTKWCTWLPTYTNKFLQTQPKYIAYNFTNDPKSKLCVRNLDGSPLLGMNRVRHELASCKHRQLKWSSGDADIQYSALRNFEHELPRIDTFGTNPPERYYRSKLLLTKTSPTVINLMWLFIVLKATIARLTKVDRAPIKQVV